MTLWWSCLQLHQDIKYVKSLGIMLSVNTLSGIDFKSSALKICPFYDELCSKWLNDEALKAAIDKGNYQMLLGF